MELSSIFLGGTPPKGIKFRAPGAVHHARWMAKGIYSLKIYLFKEQFNVKQEEVYGLREICIIIILFYVKPWFEAPNAIKAPNQDWMLLQRLIEYQKINADVSKAASTKLLGHLWYISEDLVALSLFDDTVTSDIKLKMIRGIKEREGAQKVGKRIVIDKTDCKEILHKDVSDFITKNSMFLFTQYNLPYSFLDVSPDSWNTHESYIQCRNVFKNLKVVNDTAERAVALVQDFNLLLTKDEAQRQYLLQCVNFHRELYPTNQKKDLETLLSMGDDSTENK